VKHDNRNSKRRLSMAKPTTPPLPDRFMTPEEVGHLLGVPVKTLYNWRSVRSGPPAFRVGRHLRYDPAALSRWIEERTDDFEAA
jgi:excisionase family DNA binding protein